jgi:hypothetical protein
MNTHEARLGSDFVRGMGLWRRQTRNQLQSWTALVTTGLAAGPDQRWQEGWQPSMIVNDAWLGANAAGVTQSPLPALGIAVGGSTDVPERSSATERAGGRNHLTGSRRMNTPLGTHG